MLNRLLYRVEQLKNDREHGAAQIYREGAGILLQCLEDPGCFEAPYALEMLIKALVSAQPSMATLLNLCNRVLLFVEAGELDRARNFLAEETKERSSYLDAMTDRVLPLLQRSRRLVVFSYSSTVTSILLRCGLRVPVLAHVGHPLEDGVKSAEVLAENGFDVTLTSDLCLAGMLVPGDTVLTGCDALLRGGIVNRAGTYPLALAARHKRVPLVVVTEENKILHPDLEPLHQLRAASPEELGVRGGAYTIHHFYFETVPPQLVDRVITESRAISGVDIHRVAEECQGVSRLLLRFGKCI